MFCLLFFVVRLVCCSSCLLFVLFVVRLDCCSSCLPCDSNFSGFSILIAPLVFSNVYLVEILFVFRVMFS